MRQWPIRPELIPVPVTGSNWEYFYFPLDGILVHRGIIGFVHQGGERRYESKVSSLSPSLLRRGSLWEINY